MNRIASSHFDSFDPEVIEAARDVASRAGVPLEAWIASVMPQTAAPMADRDAAAHRRAPAGASNSGVEAPATSAVLSVQEGVRTGPTGTDGGEPVQVTALINRLDGLDRSMEAERRAEQRRLEEIEARIDKALHTGPVQQRLGDIERRVAQLGDQVAHTRTPGKRGKVAAEEMREAVLEIRQRQRELVATSQSEGAVASLHRDLARRLGGETAPVRRPIGLPTYVAEELQREATRLRSALTQFPTAADIATLETAVGTLSEAVDRAHPGIDLATIALPIALVRARIEQLSTEADAVVHNEVAADIQDFAGRLDVAAAFDDPKAEGTPLHALFAELDLIREAVATLAEPDRMDALVKQAQTLSARVTQSLPPHEAELRPILEEIRSEERLSDMGALASEIHGLVAKVDELHAAAHAEAAARIAAEAEAATLKTEAEAEAATLETGNAVTWEATRETVVAEAATSEAASIHAMLQTLADKVDRVNERAGTDGLDALERHVLTLMDRIESPHVLDPALNSLERTMNDLMHQVEALRGASPNEEQIERATRNAVSETLQAVSLNAGGGEIGMLRASLADMQARQLASDERLSSTLEGVQTALDRLVTRLGTAEQAPSPRPPSLDERLLASTSPEATRGMRRPPSLEGADSTASDRLAEALLEPGAGRPPRSPAPVSESAAEAALSRASEPKRPEPRKAEPKLGETKPVETRLADLALPEATKPEPKQAPTDGDIKTSFIAAARRAAQAAQAELAAEAPLERQTRARPSVTVAPPPSRMSRLRAGADQHRKSVLLGLAAVVLTIGAFGLRSGDDAAPPAQLAQAPEVAPQQPSEPEKPADAQKSAEAAKTPEAQRTAEAPKASPEPSVAPGSPVAKAPEAAPAKPAIPPVVGMPGLAGDLATVPASLDRLKQAALGGDGRAVWDLAMRESEGRGMPRDLAVATKLFERLATAGYAPAQYKLGAHYEKGTGVSRDLAQAKLWYGRAAEQGHARAMHNLGVIFAENPGPGGKPDFASAATWFRQGAEHGVRDSQYNIAVLYARGLGLSQDLVQSYAWFSAAASQGDDDAGKKRDDVATKLSPPDLARAKSLTASFKPRKLDPAVNEPPVVQDVSQGPVSLLGAPVPAATAFTPSSRKAI